ncbi:MAG: hypothetical protein ACUVSX_15870 [Aggregatilineales bacterium]
MEAQTPHRDALAIALNNILDRPRLHAFEALPQDAPESLPAVDVALIHLPDCSASAEQVLSLWQAARPHTRLALTVNDISALQAVTALSAGAYGFLVRRGLRIADVAAALRDIHAGTIVTCHTTWQALLDFSQIEERTLPTARQMEVILSLWEERHAAEHGRQPLCCKQIARNLGMEERTLYRHLSEAGKRLGVSGAVDDVLSRCHELSLLP